MIEQETKIVDTINQFRKRLTIWFGLHRERLPRQAANQLERILEDLDVEILGLESRVVEI